MAKKRKIPTGAKLAMINGVLRGLAMCDIFVGDRTVVRLTKEIEHRNAVDAVVHTSKVGDCFVAEVGRYEWTVIIPNPALVRMSWLANVGMDECEVVPKTVAEQAATMMSYIDINDPSGQRLTAHVNAPEPRGASDIYPV